MLKIFIFWNALCEFPLDTLIKYLRALLFFLTDTAIQQKWSVVMVGRIAGSDTAASVPILLIPVLYINVAMLL